ncbi:MAG: phenylacetate--CoA ligase family protein [Acutalibacteraceae bacterium]
MMKKAIEAIEKGYFDMPFYTQHCQKNGVDLSKVRTKEQFLQIPFTTKDDLRNTCAFSRTKTAPQDIYGIYSSNGTTGKKTFYVHSQADHEKQAEFVRTFYSAIGMKAGGLGAVLGPIGSPIMGHCMMWQFHAMKMGMTLCPEPSPENMIDVIQSLPVTDIATLPQVASFMAAKPEWREIAANSSVERLVLGGDFLSEARRKLLEETWNAKVYNSFGMSEVFGPIGNECIEHNGFHYFDKDLYIEIVSEKTGKPVAPGEIGVGVYTTLWEKGFPLLRYWSGDLLRLIPQPCPCGSSLPRFEFFGRMADCVQLSDGTWISPRQVEELTLPNGLIHCQVQLRKEASACLIYDEAGAKPTEDLILQLKQLLSCDSITVEPMPLEKMQLRGLKPKYLVKAEN